MILALAAAAALSTADAPPPTWRTHLVVEKDLLADCDPMAGATEEGAQRLIECISYLEGVTDAFDEVGKATGAKFYCPPQRYNMGQVAGAVHAYVAAHPEKWGYVAVDGVYEGLKAKWPCR